MGKLLALSAVLYSAFSYPAFGSVPSDEGQDLGWAIWGSLSEAAKSCKRETNTRDFLGTAGMVVGDPEHSKVFSDVVESLATENPGCFLSAANSLQPRELKLVIENFLAKPIQHSPKEIEASLAKYWEQDVYANIRRLYLEARQ